MDPPLYSGCQKNVPVFKRFFYNRTFFYAAIRNFIMESSVNDLARVFDPAEQTRSDFSIRILHKS
jgi:hypothetical protein